MPNSFSTHKSTKILMVLGLLGAAITLVSATKGPFTIHDKAFFADSKTVDFVRPGLVLTINSASVASDGTITTTFTITDRKGLPLDKDGVTTPGVVAPGFIAAYIPKDATQYVAYTTRSQTSPITNVTAIQAGADGTGTYTKVADGQYTYTFKTKAPAGFDATATHTIGIYASRDLTEFDLGTNYASTTFNFVPNGSAVTAVRDVIKTASCNKCHDQLSFHGGRRRGIEMCVLCHTPQTKDPDTGNTVDMKVMVHKIHMGENLPSVIGGKPYQIIGFQQSVSDWSTVAYPANVKRCESCHEQGANAATQATNYLTKPTRDTCGSCHDNINFASGENHSSDNLPQVSDNQCANCHIPQGELEFDASIKGAHIVEQDSAQIPGVVVEIVKVDNGLAGEKPTVTFTLKDNAGNAIPLDQMKVSPSRLRLNMTGPATDYGYTNFGSDVTTTGYVLEDASKTSTCGSDGTCTYTFVHAVPADAKGTFAMGIEARRGITLNSGMSNAIDSEYGAINKVAYFSVDGSPVQPRRTVVDVNNCNRCHYKLSLHGENRNQPEYCAFCHNPANSAANEEPNGPTQSINLALMVHKIHSGELLVEEGGNPYIVGNSDFSEVRYPAMAPTGEAGDRRNCSMCHTNGSEQNLPTGLNKVVDPQGLVNPDYPITSACTACHVSVSAKSHALVNTSTLGESCEVCHGADAQFSVSKVHAQY